MSKRKRNRNPVLKQKYDEGFEDGIKHATRFFIHKFNGLDDVDGIGPATMQKIKMQLGAKYFEE